jgi:hypothetical protein
MGIDVHLESEDGESIQVVGDPQNILSRAVLDGLFDSGLCCLRFVDPYGDAIFNYLQWPVLAEELSGSLASIKHPELSDHLEKILRLIHQSRKQRHCYIKFIGD